MTTCVIGTREHPAADGSLLCLGHLQKLAGMLAEIEDETAILSAMPSMQQHEGTGGAAPAFTRSPAVLDAIVATDPRHGVPALSERSWDDATAYDETASVLFVLNSWARIVREERELAAATAVTVTGERALLLRHLPWIAAQPWCDECYDDLRKLLAQLRATNHTGPDRPYCDCPAIVGGQSCTGQVWIRDELQPVWRRLPDRCSRSWEQAPGAAVCDTCGTRWATERERQRLERMRKDATAERLRPRTPDGRPMLTAQELVDQGIVTSLVNVRVIAHRKGIVSVNGHYDPAAFGERMAG